MYTYEVCHHSHDECVTTTISFVNPVSIGDYVSNSSIDPEYEVFVIVHDGDGVSTLHVRDIQPPIEEDEALK